VPVTVLVLRNDEYGVLKNYRDKLGLSGVPGLDIGGIDNLALAQAYGMPAQRVETTEELTGTLRRALATATPHLIEVPIAGDAAPVTLW
jgi:benzoylformate decarboxylase